MTTGRIIIFEQTDCGSFVLIVLDNSGTSLVFQLPFRFS